MNIKEENLCKLCLVSVGNDLQVINEVTMEIFHVILLNMDLDISKNLVICRDCTEMARTFVNFKMACLNTEQNILSVAISKPETKVDLKDVRKSNKHLETVPDDDKLYICRFCLNQSGQSNFVSMDGLMMGMLFMEMLPVFMPEMDFDITDNPVICTICREQLGSYLRFIQNYLNTCRNSSEGSTQICMIKLEADVPEYVETLHAKECDRLIKIEEIWDIEQEEVVNAKSLEEKPNVVNSGAELYKFNAELKLYTCMQCTYETKNKKLLKMHITNHKDVSEVETYRCAACTFKTRHKNSLKRHELIHKDASEVKTHKCTICSYHTKLKSNLKNHMLVHKDASEVEMYNCASCTYTTKYKNYLKTHKLTHMEPLKVTYYKCAICLYEARYKKELNAHAIIHKNPLNLEDNKHASEIENYENATLGYDTKHQVHQAYKCTKCTYESNTEKLLKSHMTTHENASEVNIYRCATCTFETRYKKNLKHHVLTHKDVSEVETYKCTLCAFQTKLKCNLKIHMLIHKDPSEVVMHKCMYCKYETKYKKHLKTHAVTHMKSL